MKLSLSILTYAFLALPAHAAEGHDHEEGFFDVESYQLTLKGTEAFGEACYLGVVKQGTNADGKFYALLETSFEHEGEGPGRLYATLDGQTPSRLSALTANGGRISVELNPGFTSLRDALRYAVEWRHEGHTDTGFCGDLKLIHDAAAE